MQLLAELGMPGPESEISGSPESGILGGAESGISGDAESSGDENRNWLLEVHF